MKLLRTEQGGVVERDGKYFAVGESNWDSLLNKEALGEYLAVQRDETARPERVLAPLASQELWAAGVTYLRSKQARMEESQDAGGGDFYDRVYAAERPEIFFKSVGWRVAGDRADVRIRADSRWNVPEPELVLVINARAEIIGYSIGNDMSSRDIEGENPLYLPQAKMYDGAAAVGPGIWVTSEPLPRETPIRLEIRRGGAQVFNGSTSLASMKRTPQELVGFLYREMTFPAGALLMTGAGIVPPDDFTLQSGDEIVINIEPIGTLTNRVA